MECFAAYRMCTFTRGKILQCKLVLYGSHDIKNYTCIQKSEDNRHKKISQTDVLCVHINQTISTFQTTHSFVVI